MCDSRSSVIQLVPPHEIHLVFLNVEWIYRFLHCSVTWPKGFSQRGSPIGKMKKTQTSKKEPADD